MAVRISVCGCIGSGKTTLINKLREEFPNSAFIPEYIDGDPEGKDKLQKYLKGEMDAFEFQNYILDYYREKYVELNHNSDPHLNYIFIERCPLEGIEIFARKDMEEGKISGREYYRLQQKAHCYCHDWYPHPFKPDMVYTEFPDIDRVIYDLGQAMVQHPRERTFTIMLVPGVQVLNDNIHKRNREGEVDAYTKDFITEHHQRYMKLIK